ncbi:MAG TPA: hypothetical protein H9955_00650 [Candidatus Mediterraneibacter cottocaccae]|nr:hypothetical protein [Candidatus Mediterraneibacter cottocaccae]
MQEMTTATQPELKLIDIKQPAIIPAPAKPRRTPERKHLTKAQKLNVILGGIIAVLSVWIYILQAGAV